MEAAAGRQHGQAGRRILQGRQEGGPRCVQVHRGECKASLEV